MNQPRTRTAWQPQPGAGDPGRGGMSQLAAYDAGLTENPGCWIQPVRLYPDPRLDPASPDYDPDLADQVAWEERGAAQYQDEAQSPRAGTGPQAGTGPETWPEPELPF